MTMKTSTLFLLAAILSGMFACTATPKPVALFNGRNLDGWIGYLDDKSLDPAQEFTAREGVIRLSGKLGYLYTREAYSDYRLEVEWRWIDTATNSGIFIHLTPAEMALPPTFECQLKAGNAGFIYSLPLPASGGGGPTTAAMRQTGTNSQPRLLPSNEKAVGEWNRAEIVCAGDRITVHINGELQNEAVGTSVTSGHIALQSEGEAVEFRNVVLTPLK